jgi:hypothetical protein
MDPREAVRNKLWSLGYDFVSEVLETRIVVAYRGKDGEYNTLTLKAEEAL